MHSMISIDIWNMLLLAQWAKSSVILLSCSILEMIWMFLLDSLTRWANLASSAYNTHLFSTLTTKISSLTSLQQLKPTRSGKTNGGLIGAMYVTGIYIWRTPLTLSRSIKIIDTNSFSLANGHIRFRAFFPFIMRRFFTTESVCRIVVPLITILGS
jgi:hypothetical protein